MALAETTTGLLDYAWMRIRARLDGLTDDEYLWEPVPGCWSVRPVDDRWEIERVVPDPEPAPVTTIAWRTWHIGAECIDGFCAMAFGEQALDLGAREWFGTGSEALAALDAAWSLFGRRFHELDDEAMGRALGPEFGPYAESNHADLLLHVADELVHHGAEIALLRDLHRAGGVGGRRVERMPGVDRTVVERWLAAGDAGDLDAFEDLLHPDAVVHAPRALSTTSRAEEQQVWREALDAMPDLHHDVQEVLVGDDVEMARVVVTGTMTAGFGGVEGTGQSFRMDQAVVVHLRDGRVAEAWEIADVGVLDGSAGDPPAGAA